MQRTVKTPVLLALLVSLCLHAGSAQAQKPGAPTLAATELVSTIERSVDNLFAKGHYAQALPIYRQLLNMREDESPPNKLTIAESLSKLATALQMQGIYPDALLHFDRALTLREKWLGAKVDPEFGTVV